MDFGTNKTTVKIIKEGTFGGTYGNKNSWKKFNVLENIDQKYYCPDYYDVSVNKYGVLGK